MLFGAGGGRPRWQSFIPLTELDKIRNDHGPRKRGSHFRKSSKRNYMMTSGIGTDEDITDIQLAKIFRDERDDDRIDRAR